MKKCLLCLICMLFLIPVTTKALMCSNEKKARFREQAKNISVNYEYTETEDDIIFNIKFTNVPSEFYIFNVENGDRNSTDNCEIVISNVEKNKSYKYWVYTTDSLCDEEVLYTHYITIPAYNKYYKDKLCTGIEDYKLCSKWLNTNMSYEEWQSKVNKYLKSLEKKEEVIEEEKTEGIFDQIIAFYGSYYYFILPGIIICAIIGMVLYNKKHDLF